MEKSNSESWSYDYFKRVEFVVKSDLFIGKEYILN